MSELILGISALLIVFLMVWLFNSTERRITKSITKEANKKGFKVLEIRESINSDGRNPFITFDVFPQARVLSALSTFDFIVTVENGELQEKHWVRVKGWSSITTNIEWAKKVA